MPALPPRARTRGRKEPQASTGQGPPAGPLPGHQHPHLPHGGRPCRSPRPAWSPVSSPSPLRRHVRAFPDERNHLSPEWEPARPGSSRATVRRGPRLGVRAQTRHGVSTQGEGQATPEGPAPRLAPGGAWAVRGEQNGPAPARSRSFPQGPGAGGRASGRTLYGGALGGRQWLSKQPGPPGPAIEPDKPGTVPGRGARRRARGSHAPLTPEPPPHAPRGPRPRAPPSPALSQT